jgi:hypothetical protein
MLSTDGYRISRMMAQMGAAAPIIRSIRYPSVDSIRDPFVDSIHRQFHTSFVGNLA